MHRQFFPGQCVTNVSLETDLLQETESKLLRENRKPVLFLLGIVHCDISVSEDLFRCVVFGIARGDPDIYVDLDLVSAKGKGDRKSTRLNSSHSQISYAVFCLKNKNT